MGDTGTVAVPEPSENVRALCLLNLQNDFVEEGKYPIQEASECIKLLSLVRRSLHWDYVFFFTIEHPTNHQHFMFNNMQQTVGWLKSGQPNDELVYKTPYCLFGSQGAALHEEAGAHPLDFRISMRIKASDTGWSLVSSAERDLPSFQKILHDHAVKECYFGGIMTDKCLAPIVKDTQHVVPNVRTIIFSDGICPKNDETVTNMLEQLSDIDVEWISSEEMLNLGTSTYASPRRYSTYRRRSSTASETLGRLPTESDSTNSMGMDSNIPGGTHILKKWLKIQGQSTRQCHDIRPQLFRFVCDFQNCSTTAKLCMLCESLTSEEVNTNVEPYGVNLVHIAIGSLTELLVHKFFEMFDIDPNIRTGSGKSTVLLASERGRVSILERILRHSRLMSLTTYTPDNRCGFTPIMIASLKGDLMLVTRLLRAAYRFNVTAAEVLRYQAKVTRQSVLMMAVSAPLATEDKVSLEKYADVVQFLIKEETAEERLYRLLILTDTWGWNAVHFAVCSQLASLIPWRKLLPRFMSALLNHCKPISDETASLVTPSNLHLAAWSGIASSIPVMFSENSDYDSYTMKIRGRYYTPLDFAILQRNFACARHLCRLGFKCLECRGEYASEFLHFLLLSGDGVTAQIMLRDTSNGIPADEDLLELLSRIEYAGTCTFTMTSGRVPLKHYTYECLTTGRKLCLVCALHCHGSVIRGCRRLGLARNHCECSKQHCCSINTINAREKQGYRFSPRPIDISRIKDVDFSEGSELFELVEELARNSHEVWGASKIRAGWRYGEVRDNTKKLHPGLRPYWMLSEEEKLWDRESAKQSVCVIRALGYRIFLERRSSASTSRDHQAVKHRQSEQALISNDGSEYVPEPVDTTSVELTDELVNVVELLSKNMHETWAESKINAGFSYAPVRSHYLDSGAQTSPMLVPYEMLSESEKEMNRENASQLVKTMLVAGYTIERDESAEAVTMTKVDKDLDTGETEILRRRQLEMPTFRKGFIQALVFIYACQGNMHNLNKLFEKQPKPVMEALKLKDNISRSPLYYTVLYAFSKLCEWMLTRGASANCPDENGTSLLSLAAMQGNEEIVELLVSHGSHCDARDNLGLSALHYAAFSGQLNTTKCILDRFSAFAEHAAVDMISRSAFSTTSQGSEVSGKASPAKGRWAKAIKSALKSQRESKTSNTTAFQTESNQSLFADTSKLFQLEVIDISWFHEFSSHDWNSDSRSDVLRHYASSEHLRNGNTVVEKDLAAAAKFFTPGDALSSHRNRYCNNITCVLTPAKVWVRALPRDPNLRHWRDSAALQKLFSIQGDSRSQVLLSPMTVAVHVGNLDIAKLLIDRGSNPTKHDYSLLTPYERALYQHRMESEVRERLCTLKVDEMTEVAHNPTSVVRRLREGWSGQLEMRLKEERQAETGSNKTRSVVTKVFRQIVKLMRSYAARNQLSLMDQSILGFMPRYRLADKDSLSFSSVLSAQVVEYFKRLVLAKERKTIFVEDVDDDDKTLKRFDIRRGLGQRTGSAEKEVALLEQRRQRAFHTSINNLSYSRDMLDQLEETSQTQSRRQNFAITQFFKLIVHLLAIVVLFIMMTPISPDYDGGSVAEMSLWVRNHFHEYSDEVYDRHSWWKWFDDNILQDAGDKGLFETTGVVSEITESNMIVGAIRLAIFSEPFKECSMPHAIRPTLERCVSEYRGMKLSPSIHYSQSSYLTVHELFSLDTTESDEFLVFDLDSGNSTQRRRLANRHGHGKSSDWMSKETRFVSLDFTIYNPNIRAFASVKVGSYFSSVGSCRSDVLVKTARPFNGRFAPSFSFQMTLGAMLVIQILILFRDVGFAGIKTALKNGWNWLELLLAGMLSVILLLDITSTQNRDSLRIDLYDTSRFTSLWQLASRLELETDLLAVAVLLMIIRFVQYLRLIPEWGPMLLAFLMTWQDKIVMLYLSVMTMLIFTFGIAFHVAFGTENPEFASVLRSFYSLFGVGFAGEFDRLQTFQPRVMYTFFYMFYVLMAVIVLNLFVGIVTEIYPRASKESTEQWERLITTQMQEEILSTNKQLRVTETAVTILETVGASIRGKSAREFVKQYPGRRLEVPVNPVFDPVYYIVGAHETHVELLRNEMKQVKQDNSRT